MKILIVDDERKACANLKNILLEYVDPGLNIVGMAYNTQEAEKQIIQLKPDAVFLDIEMPNENAFEFLDRIAPFRFEVVFVTSYDEYAIKAIKLNAIDYILKPISITELENAVHKLKEKIRYKNTLAESSLSYTHISDLADNKVPSQKIVLKDVHSAEVVDFKNICFIEAQSSYSRIVFFKNGSSKEVIMSSPLSDYEELLPPDLFLRIHRSYLINCSHIKQIFKDGTSRIMLKGDFLLPVSRRRYVVLLNFLKNNLYEYE